MEDQQFCLKWSNHHSNMVDIFGRLLTNEALCDVTLACDGFSFKAHKLVLSASSSFFQNLFLENPCTHPVIILPDLKYMDMKALVDFMYNGQVNVSESQLPKLLKAAENLRIKGLSDCRLQNSSVHSDTSEASPDAQFLKMDCSELAEQPKKAFEKDADSNSCNLEFQEPSNLCSPEMMCTSNQESKTSNQQSSDCQSSSVVTCAPQVQTSQQITDGGDPTSVSDSEIEMEPSRMMEQTMTTDHVFKAQPLDPNQVLGKESVHIEGESSINSDDASINLPDATENKELLTSMHFTKDVCSSKDEKKVVDTSSDQLGFANSSSSSKEEFIMCKEEQSISVAGPSTIVFETSPPQSQYHQESSDSQMISEKNLVRLPVSCATCNCVLNTMSDAQSHLSMNPNCRTSQFKCLLCPKLFIWPATLIKHFREQHQGPGGTARVTQRLWFFCEICKKPLLSKHALCLHRSKFHGFSTQALGSESSENINVCKRGRKQGTRVCRLCKRTFTSTDEYHMHLQDFHRNNMLFNTAVETASYVNESLSSTENESNSAQSII